MNYQPQPIDTSHVTLKTEHLKIMELLAKNPHELWSTQRLAEGWKYGPQRDDAKKEHPGFGALRRFAGVGKGIRSRDLGGGDRNSISFRISDRGS